VPTEPELSRSRAAGRVVIGGDGGLWRLRHGITRLALALLMARGTSRHRVAQPRLGRFAPVDTRISGGLDSALSGSWSGTRGTASPLTGGFFAKARRLRARLIETTPARADHRPGSFRRDEPEPLSNDGGCRGAWAQEFERLSRQHNGYTTPPIKRCGPGLAPGLLRVYRRALAASTGVHWPRLPACTGLEWSRNGDDHCAAGTKNRFISVTSSLTSTSPASSSLRSIVTPSRMDTSAVMRAASSAIDSFTED
jgi:hypothetical protein